MSDQVISIVLSTNNLLPKIFNQILNVKIQKRGHIHDLKSKALTILAMQAVLKPFM